MADKFLPPELAAKLREASGKAGMEGERRVVTMLFCDVKGSTAAAEQLDPEEWTEVINGAFEFMIRPVYKYEGTVARLMGDSILAFFGAPIAHEDDAERGVRAGLDIIEGMGPFRQSVEERFNIRFDVRVGINTGEVVVGAVGSDLRMEYTAIGDAINLASRMEQTAAPGTVQIAHDTYRLVKPLFEVEELGGILVKGKEAPVNAYRVRGVKRDPGRVRGIEGVESKLVGRESELVSLQVVLDEAQQGIGRIVTLVGDAGLGKSRLIAEAGALWKSNGSPEPKEQRERSWYRISSRAYESSQPFAAWKRLTRLIGNMPAELNGDELRDGFSRLASVLPDADRSEMLNALEALFGLSAHGDQPALEGEAFRRTLFRTMSQLWRCRHADEPAVIVFDDLHWCDPASVDMLLHLLPVIGANPIVLICAFRPDRHAPSWRFQLTADADYYHRYTEIGLTPLTAEECDRLVEHLLGTTDLPDELREHIWDRTAGNPFFIEEVIRALIDDGSLVAEDEPPNGSSGQVFRATSSFGKNSIPDNIQALLSARLDRLDQGSRQVVEMASVIGRSFNASLLRSAVSEGLDGVSDLDASLNELLKREMIQELSRYPDLEYRFRNPLLQETAYKTILHKRRRQYHRRVAESIEQIYADQLDAWVPQLAFHFSEALDKRAISHHIGIGDNAFALYANKEAATHYWSALQLALVEETVDPAQLNHIYRRRGRALELDGLFADALANYKEMELAAQRRGHARLELEALVLQGTIRSNMNDQYDPAEAEQLAERALPMADALGDDPARATIYWNLLNAYRFTDRVDDALQAGEESVALARKLGLKEQLAYSLNDIAHVYQGRKSPEEAKKVIQEAGVLWRELGNKPMLADSLSNAGTRYAWNGAYEASLAASEEAFAISQSIENLWGMAYSKFAPPLVHWERGEVDLAIEAAEACIHYGKLAGFRITDIVPGLLALFYAELGDLKRARDALDSGSEQLGRPSPVYSELAITAMSKIHIVAGELEAADEQLKRSATGSDGNWYTKAYKLRAQAQLALARSKWETAEAFLSRLEELVQRVGLRMLSPELGLLRSKALVGLGKHGKAAAILSEAKLIAEEMGAQWQLWQILGGLSELESDPLKAADLKGEARRHLEMIAEKIGSDDLRAHFLNRPDARALLAADAT
jgi:class 3 adenylate cyclase